MKPLLLRSLKFYFPLTIFFIFVVFVSPARAAARTLTLGLSGSDVTALQNELTAQGYLSASATGYFGPATLAAVKKFQCDKGVICSGSSYGTAGPLTQAALGGAGTSNVVSGGTLASDGGSVMPLSSGALSGESIGPAWTGKLEVGGWIPYWRTATGTQDVLPHLSQMTEISPFVITLKSDGTLYDAGGLTGEPWVSFIAAAKAQKVRVVPTVMSGDGALLQSILSNTTSRVALEDAIATMATQGNWDGVDIDFEAKDAQTENYFSTFLKGLYQRMGNKLVYCSIEARMPLVDRYGIGATPPPDATEYANDYVALNKYCDRVEIMAYDQGTIDLVLDAARAAPYAPVADPAWVENIVALASQTIAKKKIIIGVPTYGYEYSVTPQGAGYQYDVQGAFNQGYGTQLAAQLGITPVRNSAGELSFIYKSTPQTDAAVAVAGVPGSVALPQGNTVAPPSAVYSQQAIAGSIQPPFNYLSWSDAQAIKDKIALAQKLGVRGVAIFEFNGGEDPNIWSVLP